MNKDNAIHAPVRAVRVIRGLASPREIVGQLKVRVIPNAKKTEFGGYREGELVLRVNAPALEGKANKAAGEFVARYFGVSRSAVSLLSGEKSRHKIFQIVGLESSDLERELAERSK